ESADERPDRAVLGVHREEGRLDFRKLHDVPVLAFALHANDRAAADAPLRRRLRVQAGGGELQAFAGDRDFLAGPQRGVYLLRGRGGHDRGQQVVAVRVIHQQVVVVVVLYGGGKLLVAFRAAIAGAVVVVEDRLSERGIGRFLIILADGGVDAEASRVDVVR